VILVAAVGNLWLGDDGFGSAVAGELRARELPGDVAIADFGTGGLDLAYEVMRGYDALVLVDVSRQGGEPGTLYVMEVEPDAIEAGIEDGAQIDPHGMDPQTVLRFVKAKGGWPGRVMVIACEPERVEEVGIGLTPQVEAAVERAVELVTETVEELRCTSSR
jgi:hydrogenase maturation protease